MGNNKLHLFLTRVKHKCKEEERKQTWTCTFIQYSDKVHGVCVY